MDQGEAEKRKLKKERQKAHLDISHFMGAHEVWPWELKKGLSPRRSPRVDPRGGETIAKVQDIVMADRRVSVRHIANTLDISFGSVQTILTKDLEMRKVSARWVPKLVNNTQNYTDLKQIQTTFLTHKSSPSPHGSLLSLNLSWTRSR